MIENLKLHRSIRSINSIGTACKWIAGTPDHDDMKIATDKRNKLLVNNNKQVVINRELGNKIQTITNITNELINYVKTSNWH